MVGFGMIRLLKRIADWLDRRFPPRLVVTQEAYDALLEKQHSISKRADKFRDELNELAVGIGKEIKADRERISALEKSLAAMKELLAKGGATMIKTEADKLRDQFVKGDFQRGGQSGEAKA